MDQKGRILIGGHRGAGCTDHHFYDFRDIQNLPVENTLSSIEEAFRLGADYIECDAVSSLDNILFLIHNTIPADHYFGSDIPKDRLNKLTWDEIRQYKSGRLGKGTPPTLKEVLATIEKFAPVTSPFVINIEIKGTQNSRQPRDGDAFFEALTKTVQDSGAPPERILFSSFSMENLIRTARTLPNAKYGLLFDEGAALTSIYTDETESFENSYIPFTRTNIERALSVWNRALKSSVPLSYLNPEIATITDDTLNLAQEKNLGINSWSIFERMDSQRSDLHKSVVKKMTDREISYTVITDYISEMKKILASIEPA